MSIGSVQDKQKEIAFFDAHASSDEYDVFTPEASARLISAFVRLSGLPRGAPQLHGRLVQARVCAQDS